MKRKLLRSLERSGALEVMDPRDGKDFTMNFRPKGVYRASEYGHIALQSRSCDYRLCLQGHSMQELVQLIASQMETRSVLVQVGPPFFKECVREPPTGWEPMASCPKAMLYKTSPQALGLLAAFFDRAAHYEQWVFYFHCQDLLDQNDVPKIEYVSLNMLAGRNIPWEALLWYESDSGMMFLLLPCTDTSRELIDELALRDIAVRPGKG